MPSIPYMKLKPHSPTWYTAGPHPALPRRPCGRMKAQCVCTGIPSTDLTTAAEFSKAYGQFLRDPKWHTPAQFKLARELHQLAAEIFYLPWKQHTPTLTDLMTGGIRALVPSGNINELEELLALKTKADKLALALAEEQAANTSLKKELGKVLVGSDHKFTDISRQYLEWGKAQGGRGGRPWSEEHAEKRETQLTHWAKTFPSLGKINVLAVEAAQRAMLKTKGTKTVSHYTDALTAMLTWCVGRNLLLTNPLANLGALESKAKSEYRALTIDEVALLMTKVKPDRRLIYGVALCTGLRAKELKSLRVSDFNADESVLVLRESITKNGKSALQRLPPFLCNELARTVKGKSGGDRLLPSMPDGKGTAKWFKLDCDRAGINTELTDDGKLVFHSLRVTHATLGMALGGSAKSVMTSMRHGSLAMTSRYVKAVDSDVARMVDAIGDLVRVGQSSGQSTEGA